MVSAVFFHLCIDPFKKNFVFVYKRKQINRKLTRVPNSHKISPWYLEFNGNDNIFGAGYSTWRADTAKSVYGRTGM